MDWLQALILGIVQGAAEYLPISSSGHLVIFRELLHVDLPADQNLQFDIMVHAATVCSTIVVLRHMFKDLVRGFFSMKRNKESIYVWKVLLSCVPVGIVGVFFKDKVEAAFDEGLGIVGVCLIITAILLTFAFITGYDRKTHRPVPADRGRNISWLDAFIIGCSQAVAVLPGLSRSGTTIATGIMLGDKRDKVATFSFIMVVIPILGEALLDLAKMLRPAAEQASGALDAGALIIGFLSAFIVGCAACKWMIALVKKGKLIWFALYCLIMGIICICW